MVTLSAPQCRNRVPPITILIPRSGGSAASFGSAVVKPKWRPLCTSSAQVWEDSSAAVPKEGPVRSRHERRHHHRTPGGAARGVVTDRAVHPDDPARHHLRLLLLHRYGRQSVRTALDRPPRSVAVARRRYGAR